MRVGSAATPDHIRWFWRQHPLGACGDCGVGTLRVQRQTGTAPFFCGSHPRSRAPNTSCAARILGAPRRGRCGRKSVALCGSGGCEAQATRPVGPAGIGQTSLRMPHQDGPRRGAVTTARHHSDTGPCSLGHRGSRLRVDCWAAPSISTGHGVGGPATCGTPHPRTMRRLGHDGRGRGVGQTPARCPARASRRDHPGATGTLGQPRRRRRSCQKATAAAPTAAGCRAR